MNRPSDVTPQAEERVSTAPPPRPRQHTRPRLVFTVLLLTAVVILFILGGRFLLARLNFVQETDARIVADVTLISSRVSGRLVVFTAAEGSRVAAGEILGRIDDAMARAELKELASRLDTALAEQSRIEAEIALVEAQSSRRAESERAKLAAAQALHESLNLEFRFAREDHQRARRLSAKGVIARKRLDEARTIFNQARQALLGAKARVATAQADLGAVLAERQRTGVLRRQIIVLGYQAAQTQARIEAGRVALAERVIRSPIAGIVNRTFVNRGEFVAAGQRIALVHDPDNIWIEALVKETEIRRVRLGQRVAIAVDAYPERAFTGIVSRLGQATTSEFSLLPSTNPSGNFTKVTQRLPVRIAIEQIGGLLKPGMMVEVAIDVRGR